MPDTNKVICDCGREFRVKPEQKPVQKFNSTIKTKPKPPPTKCNICTNTELLKQAKFNTKKKEPIASKYTIKEKGKKRLKTPHERFYGSTAWKWFSHYVLLYYSINGTAAKCCTCGTIKTLNNKELHTGHWIKVFNSNSTNYSTAFEFTNLGPQCSKCNRWNGGHERLMQIWLTEKHGPGEVSRLTILSNKAFKLDDYTLAKIAGEYRLKFNNLLQEKNWKNPWKK
jgi:hypothetical protein